MTTKMTSSFGELISRQAQDEVVLSFVIPSLSRDGKLRKRKFARLRQPNLGIQNVVNL
jgi:hypothetical protein